MWKTALALVCAATLAGCGPSTSGSDGKNGPAALTKITVAFTGQPQSTLVHVALAKGYFADQGLAVDAQMHSYGKAALQSVIDGKADLATVAETPIMFSVLSGNAIVARKDAGISAAADLKAKRIGYTPGTTSDFFLDSWLSANGLTRGQITAVALKPEAMADAVTTGEVDAVSTWNYPLVQIRQQLGANGTILYDREIYTETFNVAARQEFVRDHPETAQRFLRALIKAESFAAKNPDDAQNIMAVATKIDKALIREVWDAFSYHVGIDRSLLITLEDETRWAIKNRLTGQTAMPDYANTIHLDSLRAVKPDTVKTLR